MHGHLNVPSWSCSQAVSKSVWHVTLLCVQWKTPDDGQRNCLKRVEFYSKNKFEKLVQIFGFIIRIHHDARSPERSVLILLASCQQICMTCTIAVCTVKNSWWWTEKLSETCRDLFQNKFEKLVQLFGFIIRIHHNARSPELQILIYYHSNLLHLQ